MADGMTMNFGPLSRVPINLLRDPSYGYPSLYHEHGFNTGLSIGFNNYRLPAPVGFRVRIDGKEVPNGYFAKTAEEWGSSNLKRHLFEVDWHYRGGLTLRVDGETIFNHLDVPGFVPQVGDVFGFGARTGTGTQEMALDNITILTGGVLTPLPVSSPYHSNSDTPPSKTAAMAFDGDLSTAWQTSGTSGHIGAGFTVPKTVRAYTVTNAVDQTYTSDPRSWGFETSDDGINWTNRGGAAAQIFATRTEQRSFLVQNPVAAREFRLNITENRGDGNTQLAEVVAWELTPEPSPIIVSTLADDGPGSLRQALADAAASQGRDLILFSQLLQDRSVTLSSPLVVNDTDSVTIDGLENGGIHLISGGDFRAVVNSGPGVLEFQGLRFTGADGGQSTGGGLSTDEGSTTFVASCHFGSYDSFAGLQSSNGGAVSNAGTLTISRTTVAGGTAQTGGGVYNTGTLVVQQSTFTENAGHYGGAIANIGGSISVDGSTISGNTATGSGGGIHHAGAEGSTFGLSSSIVAENSAPDQGKDIHLTGPFSVITRELTNIVRSQLLQDGATESGPAATNADPLLAPLGNYGGFTRTMALRPGSPASGAYGAALKPADQRGNLLSYPGDIGAYEVGNSWTYEAWSWESLPSSLTALQRARDSDLDGDGHSNFEEWVTGHNLQNAGNYFKTTTTRLENGTLNISFMSESSRFYTIQYSNDLEEWTSGETKAGTGGTISFSVEPQVGGKSFVRVKVSK